MLKKKKGNIPSSNVGHSGNHTVGNSKIRCPAVIPAASELDNSGFDESQTTPGNKTQIYSTTV